MKRVAKRLRSDVFAEPAAADDDFAAPAPDAGSMAETRVLRHDAQQHDASRAVAAMADVRQMRLLAKLAEFLLRPVGFVDPGRLRAGPLGPEAIVAMARTPGFAAPINAVIVDALHLNAVAVEAELISRLATSTPHRLAALLLIGPIATVDRLAATLAAAILSKRVAGLILRSDRQRAREALGDEAFQFAVEEAPLLHAGLTELDLKLAGAGLTGAADAPEALRAEIIDFGRSALGRFCDATAPVVADLLALRFPAASTYADRARTVTALKPSHVEQVVKLVRRKEQSWSAFID